MSKITSLIKEHEAPDFSRIMARLLIIFFIFLLLFMVFVPWQQTSEGTGKVIAFSPSERVQNLHATVTGRINKWHVREGSFVKKDDPIVEIVDVDPQFMQRLKAEKDSVDKQYVAAQTVRKTAHFNFERQLKLFEKGFSSRKDYEDATIAYRSAQSAEAAAYTEVTRIDSRLSRQASQLVKAPRDGTVVRLVFGTNSVFVKEGDTLAVFVPSTDRNAVEIFIQGRDLPLVYEGRKARLQFEGWPAIQFSGWPSVAVGTFGGVVAVVEQSASSDGTFRVVIIPEKGQVWPESRFIRQGTRVNGWILLNEVSFGFEMWRQFNGFPPMLDQKPEVDVPAGVYN
jgi:multidrug efflux pump subunit AcrA (membrane-fusion protein)